MEHFGLTSGHVMQVLKLIEEEWPKVGISAYTTLYTTSKMCITKILECKKLYALLHLP